VKSGEESSYLKGLKVGNCLENSDSHCVPVVATLRTVEVFDTNPYRIKLPLSPFPIRGVKSEQCFFCALCYV
jgi:hypothetical protein